MAIDLSSVYSSQSSSSIDQMVDTFMAIEEKPLEKLEEKREGLYNRKKVLTDLHSKLSNLKNNAEELNSVLVDHFGTKKALSSDAEKIDVSATASAERGSHTLTVERLAVADTRVSKQFTDTNTSFSSFTADQTFKIEVAHPTDTDPSNRVQIDVTISADTFSQDDATVLAAISDAVNDAMNNAVLNDTISNDEKVQASVVSEESGVSRLVLRSSSSGYDYRIDFTDSADSLLDFIEVNASVQTSGSSGGYITEVGTSSSTSLLNAKFNIDGLTFYRNSNYISDVLDGVTFQLLDTFSNAETITVSSDVEAVKDDVREFLDNYNAVLNFIVENTGFNAETGEYGALSDDSRYWNIKNDLRQIMTSEISGVSNENYSRLSSIGIEGNSTGTLSIVDANDFENALNANPLNVAEIFTTADTGLADQLISYVENYLGSEGFISSSKSILDDRVTYLNDEIDRMEVYLDQRESQLRQELTKLQEAMILLGNQQTFLSNF